MFIQNLTAFKALLAGLPNCMLCPLTLIELPFTTHRKEGICRREFTGILSEPSCVILVFSFFVVSWMRWSWTNMTALWCLKRTLMADVNILETIMSIRCRATATTSTTALQRNLCRGVPVAQWSTILVAGAMGSSWIQMAFQGTSSTRDTLFTGMDVRFPRHSSPPSLHLGDRF